MMKRTAQSSMLGFTLVELLIIVTLIGIAVLIGIPTLQNYLNRAKVEGTMRNTMLAFRTARYEAIKRSRTVTVQGHLTDGWVDAYIELDDPPNNAFDAGTDIRVQPRWLLDYPVTFQSPDATIVDPDWTDGTTFTVLFQNDGSVQQEGFIRMGDERGNFIQIDIEPAATAKMSRSKYYAPESGGAQGGWLEWGQEGVAWKWY